MILLQAAKLATGAVVGSGIGTIVKNVVAATTPTGISKLQKFTITVGTAAVAGYIGKKVGDDIDESIDTITSNMREGIEYYKSRKENDVVAD